MAAPARGNGPVNGGPAVAIPQPRSPVSRTPQLRTEQPWAEVLGQRSPAAALGPEIKTAVDHRTDVLGQGRVGLEQGSDQPPFRVRQVARVASAIILVPLTIFHRPHLPPPSLLTTKLGAAW